MNSAQPQLYRAIHPVGTHLAESKTTKGAYRGMYLDDATNRLAGQTEFVLAERPHRGVDIKLVVMLIVVACVIGNVVGKRHAD